MGWSFLRAQATEFVDCVNPATQVSFLPDILAPPTHAQREFSTPARLNLGQEVLSRVPETTEHEMVSAVAAAEAALPDWRDTPVNQRQRVMFGLQQLIREHTDELAGYITLELGKVTADAKGDVFRGLEVSEAVGATIGCDRSN